MSGGREHWWALTCSWVSALLAHHVPMAALRQSAAAGTLPSVGAAPQRRCVADMALAPTFT